MKRVAATDSGSVRDHTVGERQSTEYGIGDGFHASRRVTRLLQQAQQAIAHKLITDN